MDVLTCPRCRAVQTTSPVAGEWAQCPSCRHRWLVAAPPPPADEGSGKKKAPPAAGPVVLTPALTTATPKLPPRAPASPSVMPGSDEYSPLSVQTVDEPTPSLITRHDLEVADLSPDLAASVPAAKPVVPAQARQPEPNRIAAPSQIDEGLFDRAEKAARDARSVQPTMAEAVRKDDQLPVLCPACGRSFVSRHADGERETCPVCAAVFTVSVTRRVTINGTDPLVGRVLRGCRIERKIGEGGMGAVYLAQQVSLERSVAIKVLPPELARNRNFIARFEREGKNLARINHPNILHIYDFGEDQQLGIYFMIMEFVEGRDLGEILHRERRLTPVKTLDVIRQAGLGLQMAWEKGVIHRDIKPDNLMLAGDGVWKVMDFGLAKANDDQRDVTAVGVRVGTPAFMSPEQCDGVEVDFRSDIYGLGVTAYLALTGQLPFDGETPFAIMLKHKTEPAPSLRRLAPDLPEELDPLVRRMLAKKPGDRFSSLEELVHEVEELEVKLAGTATVLRKTHGPFRALRSETPGVMSAHRETPGVMPALHEQDEPDSLPPLSSSVIPDYLRMVEPSPRGSEIPTALPPAAIPVAAPVAAAPAPAPSGSSASPSASRRAAAVASAGMAMPAPGTPMPLSGQRPGTRASIPAAGRSSSQSSADGAPARDRIARTRRRTQHDEYAERVAEAKRFAALGYHDAAASSWSQAAQLAPDAGEHARLRGLAEAARRRARMRRLGRALAVVGGLLFVAAIGVWLATPRLHESLVAHELTDVLAIQNVEVRRKALDRLIDDEQPYAWYRSLFAGSYALPSLNRAVQERTRLPAPAKADPPPLAPADNPAVAALEAKLGDDTPWRTVVQQAEALLPGVKAGDRPRVQAVLTTAQAAVAAAREELTAVLGLWSSGRHAEALARTDTFPGRHPRCSELWPDLIPTRIRVTDADSGLIVSEAQVSLQIEATNGAPALAVAAPAEGVFARPNSVPTVVTVVAAGYRSERLTIVPGPTDKPFQVVLHPGVAWQRQLMSALPWARLMPTADGRTFIALSPAALLRLRLADGEAVARLTRTDLAPSTHPEIGAAQWQNLLQVRNRRLLLTSADGAVASIGDGGAVEVLHAGRAPVLAWLDKELTLQPGQRMAVVVEDLGRDQAAIAATRVGGAEMWRRSGLHCKRMPALWQQDDAMLLLDDQGLTAFDELDGRITASVTFAGLRTTPPVWFDRGQTVVVATASGLEVLHASAAGGSSAIEAQRDPAGTGTGACLIAGEGDRLLIARADRSVVLATVADHQVTAQWTSPLPQDAGAVEHLALTGSYAALADSAGTIHLWNRQDGKPVRRIPHGSPLAAAPLVFADHLLVADAAGRLTAYRLPPITH